MPDRILTAELAQALQDESVADGEAARPVTAGRGALAYLLMAETLSASRSVLPAGWVPMAA